MQRRLRAECAFSLVELLIVLALIIVLTTMMWSHNSANYQRTKKISAKGQPPEVLAMALPDLRQ